MGTHKTYSNKNYVFIASCKLSYKETTPMAGVAFIVIYHMYCIVQTLRFKDRAW